MKKIRFGIIGCGNIANWHARSILSLERAELTAICGSSPGKKLEDFAEKYNIRNIYTDYTEMLGRKDIDAVCICTPSGMHGEQSIASAVRGKHILCEKPLDIKADVMSEMIKAAREHGVKLGCVFPNRTRSGLIKAKGILDRGELGRMTIVECQYRGYRSPGYYASAAWRGTWALDGGGCLMNQGIHAIDAMCWLAGPVESVYGTTAAMLRDIEVEDTAMALLRFANGAKGAILGTTISNVPQDGPEGDMIRIECEKGTIVYEHGRTTLFTRVEPDGGEAGVTRQGLDDEASASAASSGSNPANVHMESHTYIVRDMVSAILEDREPYITGESARMGVDLVLGIYESARTGEKIYINNKC